MLPHATERGRGQRLAASYTLIVYLRCIALALLLASLRCCRCHQKHTCAIKIILNNSIIDKGLDIRVEDEEEDVTAFAGIAASPKPSRRDFGQSTPATRADLASAMAEHTVSREGL